MSGPVAQCSEEVEASERRVAAWHAAARELHAYIDTYEAGSMTTTASAQALIAEECDAIKAMLLAKNKAYGNSALEPVRIFSKAPTDEQIRVRLDDKLSRLARGSAAGEDVEADIIGYLVLLRVSRRIGAVS